MTEIIERHQHHWSVDQHRDQSSPSMSHQSSASERNMTPQSFRSIQVQQSSPNSLRQSSRHDEPQPPFHQQQPYTPQTSSPEVTAQSDSSTAANDSSSNTALPKIKVKDLQHIQSFSDTDLGLMANSRAPRQEAQNVPANAQPQYEISDMPVPDIIEMVAGLLTKITTTNDEQHDHTHRQLPTAESAMTMSAQTASVLAFHGKNVPNITIMSYLTRIHKYCPATFDVFLSLLVYFDRITEKVNAGPIESMRQRSSESIDTDTSSEKHIIDRSEKAGSASSGLPSPPLSDSDPAVLQQLFVVDSFNIHRLVIAGVTCASKFFSDIFYTNSRYAKVGGLPLAELNHLELQFLLLNDFRLSINPEVLEAYATLLVEFYAREILAQRREEAESGE